MEEKKLKNAPKKLKKSKKMGRKMSLTYQKNPKTEKMKKGCGDQSHFSLLQKKKNPKKKYKKKQENGADKSQKKLKN